MKVLNVFGIILAWLLSIALVALLIAAPVTFSALSLLDAENITNAVADSLGTPSAAAPKAAMAGTFSVPERRFCS